MATGIIGLLLTLPLIIIIVDGQFRSEEISDKSNACKHGKKQSPINIDTNKNDNFLKSSLRIDLRDFRYPVDYSWITNDCYTMKISFNESVQPFIRLESKNYSDFRVKQVHFHWGSSLVSGSEHSINNKKFPLESHIVAWNQKYSNFKNASTSKDGILVIAVLFNISSKKNIQLDSFKEAIKNGKNRFYKKSLTLISLLPNSYNSSLYSGSLTTPPCTENVFWIVFEKPNTIGLSQMKSFYRIPNCNNRGYMGANFRQIQSLNKRTVYRNPSIKV